MNSYVRKNKLEEHNGCLYLGDEKIINGTIMPSSIAYFKSDDGSVTKCILVNFISPGTHEKVYIPYKDIVTAKLAEYLMRSAKSSSGWQLLKVLDKKLEKCLSNYIISLIDKCQTTLGYELHQGYNEFPDRTIYVAGNIIVSSTYDGCYYHYDKPSYTLSPYRSGDKFKGPQRSWISYFLDKADTFPPVLLLAALCPLILILVPEDKRSRYRFSTIIIGEPSSGKTEISKLLACWFRDIKTNSEDINIISLTSDMYSINQQAEMKDCNVILDDINTLNDYEEALKKETKLSRQLSAKQGGRYMIKGKDVGIKASIFATAEKNKLPANLISRSLIVRLTESFSPKIMTVLQDNKDLYIGFVVDLITYVCDHKAELSERVTNNLLKVKYPQKLIKKYDAYIRIVNLRAILEETLDIVLEVYYGAPKDHNTIPDSIESCFRNSIKEWTDYTLSLLAKGNTNNAMKIATRLSEMIFDESDKYVTSDVDAFLNELDCEHPKRPIFYDKDKKMYYITSRHAHRLTRSALSPNQIPVCLSDLRLTHIGKDGNTAKALKRYGCNTRFIRLVKKSLKQHYKETHLIDRSTDDSIF